MQVPIVICHTYAFQFLILLGDFAVSQWSQIAHATATCIGLELAKVAVLTNDGLSAFLNSGFMLSLPRSRILHPRLLHLFKLLEDEWEGFVGQD